MYRQTIWTGKWQPTRIDRAPPGENRAKNPALYIVLHQGRRVDAFLDRQRAFQFAKSLGGTPK